MLTNMDGTKWTYVEKQAGSTTYTNIVQFGLNGAATMIIIEHTPGYVDIEQTLYGWYLYAMPAGIIVIEDSRIPFIVLDGAHLQLTIDDRDIIMKRSR